MKRILIYGGSFDPPHSGHMRSAATAALALSPDKVFLIPAAVPPHKTPADDGASAQERLEMTRLAAAELDGAEVLDIELTRSGPSYTSDTLRELRTKYPEAELVFLVGTDMLLSLPAWHEPEVVTALSSLAVFSREMGREAEIAAAAQRLQSDFGATVYVITGEPVEVSSTGIRALLKERQGRELLPPDVYAYIIAHRLYGAKPDFDWLRTRAHSYLKPKRVAHVRGVEQEAVKLAKRWGASEGDAAEAAICHDITKKIDRTDQLRLCGKYGIITDGYERNSEKLLHAKTGAAFAGELFGLSDEVKDAIRWHTTGRAGMTTLERITYLADYIEPNRAGFAGLEELRRVCYEDLDAAMELAARMSLDEVAGRGQAPHHHTLEAWRYYREAITAKGLAPIHVEDIPDDIEF